MNPPQTDMNEDLFTRWIDGNLTPEEAASVEQYLAAEPQLRRDKEDAAQLRTLLRTHLPASLEPPSPEFFTSRVMEVIRQELPAARSAVKREPAAWRKWLRAPWFAPLASAAVLAVGFALWRPAAPAPGAPVELLAQAYTPDASITATAYYSEDAGATVIDLQNVTVPDDRDIKAFDVASAAPPAPGEPLVLYAAADSERPVFVLSLDSAQKPRVTAVH
jgi:anti-sigma factor RsiW